jgi:hypothetical protein
MPPDDNGAPVPDVPGDLKKSENSKKLPHLFKKLRGDFKKLGNLLMPSSSKMLDDRKKPEDPQPEPENPPVRNFVPGSANVREEEILRHHQQRIESIEANWAARLRPQSLPPQGQSGPEQIRDAANAANPLPTAPEGQVAQNEPATTTSNKIVDLGGENNTINQASSIYYYITNNFRGGKLEENYRGGESIGVITKGGERSTDEAADSPHKPSASPRERIIEEIQSSTIGAAFVNEVRTEAIEASNALPESDKEMAHWYYQELSESDRCFVQAAAVLHGAPLGDVAEATKELYAPLKERDKTRSAQVPEVAPPVALSPSSTISEVLMSEWMRATQANASKGESVPLSVTDPSLGSVHSLLERTHTYTLRVNGAMRLQWQDADASGLSHFSVDLLRFLARESAMEDMFGPQSGQRFLDIIGQWPVKYTGERSWRSASALGVIWWHQNARKLLWGRANEWARSEQEQDWEHAAALLDGAYQVERDTMKTGADNAGNSAVLQLLNQWVATAHQVEKEGGEGYAAARAYALIGRKSPEIALKGLDRLLLFDQPQSLNEEPRYPPEDLYVFSVFKYVDIVRSGHIRQVLKHLAENAESHAHWRGRRRENRHQSTVALQITFAVFFLTAACSLSAVDKHVPASYTLGKRLPNYPSCPDSKGRDILLAGLLARAERHFWQDQLATLLCAIIIEKNHQPALYLLRRWGEIVLKDKSKDASTIEEAYAQFLVKVGKLILAWSADRGPGRSFAIGTYKHGLSLWLTDMRLPQPDFKKLAQKVLNQLP